MSLKEDLETLDPADEVQKSFDESTVVVFGEQKLNPWTTARHCASLLLGCEIMADIGAAISKIQTKGTYPGVLKDVVVVMWLCSLPAEEVARINYATGPEDVAAAFAWADEVGLKYGGPLFTQSFESIIKIHRQMKASQFGVEPRDGAEPFKKSLTNQPGKSNSAGRQRKLAVTPPIP